MKRYESYRPSGISWIGEIPSHWEEKRLSTLCYNKSITNCAHERLLSVFLGKGIVPFSSENSRRTNPITDSTDLSKYQLVEPGDFVLNNQQAWRGSVGVSKYRGIVSPAYIVLSFSTPISREFCDYALQSRHIISQLYLYSKGIGSIQRNISWNDAKNTLFPIPPLAEQERIVEFLSTKTSLIDAQQRERERELRLLDELKQAEIANVVTHGLNPNAPMRDSGIFWLPAIPAHWQVRKIKHILQKLDRIREPNSELLICSNSGKVYPRGDAKLGLVSENETIYQGVKAGDLLIHGMDTWHGAIGISEYDGMCTPVVHVCESAENKKFIFYYLRHMAHQKIFKLMSNGVRQNTSDFRSWDKLAAIPIPIPPLDEQKAIVEYIERRDRAIDAMIANLRAEIDFLTEYKQRLIADVVTGQIKVD